ncbi:epimerase [Microbacterium sp.]|uniref:epimerase n=1 Tax=Microbacterium sp. TaxID=51671 RepID=UPI003F9D723D
MTGRVVIGGSSGFMGKHLQEKYRGEGREVVTISRSSADLAWADQTGIDQAVDGAELVIGLAGKSVNCRYTTENRAEIFRSRLETTASLSHAIAAAQNPPALWVNSSTATIYRHAEDRPMTESGGEIGTGFSVEVAKAWEKALFQDDLPHTRRVALRSAIVLGHGGVLGPLKNLARIGLGGAQHDGPWPVSRARKAAGTAHYPGAKRGAQRFSWVHLDDIARIVDFVEQHPEVDGPVNASSPHPVDNTTFMACVRRVLGAGFGPPMPRWMLELGAIGIRTETELILKSRWVLPEKLTNAGFEFHYLTLEPALRESFDRA